jgi:hypothetical protein
MRRRKDAKKTEPEGPGGTFLCPIRDQQTLFFASLRTSWHLCVKHYADFLARG